MTKNRKIEILKDLKDVVKIALGGFIVGGIIKQEYLKESLLVWGISAILLLILFTLKTEK